MANAYDNVMEALKQPQIAAQGTIPKNKKLQTLEVKKKRGKRPRL
jgi:hypothetical protein